MAKIAYFSNQFASASGHGVARYARELYRAMAALEHPHEIVPLAAWSDREKADLEALKDATGLRLSPLGRLGTALGWTYLNAPRLEQLFKGPWDLIHDLSLGYPMATGRKRIVTIHDLGVLTHPEYFRNNSDRLTRKTLGQAVNRGDHLICVSASTAREVQQYVRDRWSVDVRDRISVIHEGVNADRFGGSAQEPRPHERPYVLAVGKISPRKNVMGILDAYRSLPQQAEVDLILLGGDGWDHQQVHAHLAQHQLKGQVHLKGYVTDAELARYYAHAELFVYPSHYEGFGLTVLEAMAAGTPVISSDRSSIPEVCGDAAILVDPSDVTALAQGMDRILRDDVLAAELVQKGHARVQALNWQECARKTLACYEQF